MSTVSMWRRVAAVFGLVVVILTAMPSAVAASGLNLQLVASGYDSPVFVTNAGDSRLFVVEKVGYIKIVGGGTFLDIHDLVSTNSEQGLLGLAFHPDYASNGLLYVFYNRKKDGKSVVAEFKRSTSDPNKANRSSRRALLIMGQPYGNHNGGWIAFKGNYLYISKGDGGAGGDPGNRAQDLIHHLQGKILRINPLKSGSKAYTIPGDNPFVGVPGKDEIWSYGLRNPWRCSFDPLDGTLFCGDVGQEDWEEIDRVPTGRGVNFGWRLLEGTHYYNWSGHTYGDVCSTGCMTEPIAEYPHGPECAVTGGYVARRSFSAPLYGKYIFGDYCSGKVWAIPADPADFMPGDPLPAPLDDTTYNISSFGVDNAGYLYLVDLGGAIYKLTDS
ncbi:MAG: PQQ-dependent sugar dehydrogenase [Chloroflexota bacterium]